MAYDFPNAPTLGQAYQGWVWDGEKWVSQGTTPNAVRYDLPQGLSANQTAQARANIWVTKKNYIINGAMMVSQENGSTVGNTYGYYPADLWSLQGNASLSLNIAQVASVTPAGSPNRIRVTIMTGQASPGSTTLQFRQPLEGIRVADLGWGTANAKTVTVQVGIKAPVAGTYSIQAFNVGAAVVVSGFITIAAGEVNTDVIKSVTLTGPTTGTWNKDNTLGIDLAVFLIHPSQTANAGGTAGNVFELFDVSLTEGSVAPPFQVPDYTSELALCKRFYNKAYIDIRAYNAAGSGSIFSYSYAIPEMRAIPTITAITAPTASNGSSTVVAYDKMSLRVELTCAASGHSYALSGVYAENARL